MLDGMLLLYETKETLECRNLTKVIKEAKNNVSTPFRFVTGPPARRSRRRRAHTCMYVRVYVFA